MKKEKKKQEEADTNIKEITRKIERKQKLEIKPSKVRKLVPIPFMCPHGFSIVSFF